MEPVQPTPSPEGQATTLPDAQTSASQGGRLSKLSGIASRALGLDQQPAQAAQQAPTQSFEPSPTPGLQPRIDTTPATGAVVPSPWANPDAAAAAVSIAETGSVTEPAAVVPALPEDPSAVSLTPAPDTAPAELTPISSAEPVAVVEPEPTVTPDPLATAAKSTLEPSLPATLEPAGVATPEPIAVSPVWTPAPADADGENSGTNSTIIDPDMRPSSAPSVETVPVMPVKGDSESVDASAGDSTSTEAGVEPPLIRKVIDGDLIRYEFTPEGVERMKAAFTKAIDSGAFNELAAAFAQSNIAQTKDTIAPTADLSSSIPPTETTPPPTPGGTV